MTVEEFVEKHGPYRGGYISCCTCPLYKKVCDSQNMTGHEDCWKKITSQLSRKTNQFDPEMIEALDGIICDINPTEIASQIERDHLGQWCETIRAEILKKVREPK